MLLDIGNCEPVWHQPACPWDEASGTLVTGGSLADSIRSDVALEPVKSEGYPIVLVGWDGELHIVPEGLVVVLRVQP